MRFFIIFLSILLSQLSIDAQALPVTSSKISYVYATYSLQKPDGDINKRFGISSDIGGGVGHKTKGNIMFGIEATYMFGNTIKENTLENITNSYNQITNMYGEVSDIVLRESGVQIKGSLGKIIPVLKDNKNSGIFIKGSIGFLQHKIYIESKGNNTPQVMGDYRKGYDRLCSGAMVSEFLGWQNFSNKGAYNFLVGFEFIQAKTKNRRTWDYATNKKINNNRLDLLYTFKVAWYIAFNKQQATEYFYY